MTVSSDPPLGHPQAHLCPVMFWQFCDPIGIGVVTEIQCLHGCRGASVALSTTLTGPSTALGQELSYEQVVLPERLTHLCMNRFNNGNLLEIVEHCGPIPLHRSEARLITHLSLDRSGG